MPRPCAECVRLPWAERAPERRCICSGFNLDLGSSDHPQKGFLGMDRRDLPNVSFVWDVESVAEPPFWAQQQFGAKPMPWPFPDNCVDKLLCVLPGQSVLTPTGPRPIEVIVRGDLVLGHSGFTPVLATPSRSYAGRVITIEAAKRRIVVTAEHPIAVPDGWLDADQLRESDQVMLRTAEIQSPEFVDDGEVRRSIGRCATLHPDRSVAVVEEHSTPAKTQQDVGLPSFASKVGKARGQYLGNTGEALNGERERAPRAWPPRISYATSASNFASDRRYNLGAFLDNVLIAVRDHDHRRELCGFVNPRLSYADVEGPIPVDKSGEPGNVSSAPISRVSHGEWRGRVYNLTTADGTFFVGDILTHNCSHLLEHITPAASIAVFNEMWRIMKWNGQALIVVPHGDSFGFRQDPTHIAMFNEATWAYLDPADPSHLWTVYRPLPWKIARMHSSPQHSIEVVLEPRKKADGSAVDITIERPKRKTRRRK